MMIGDVLGLGIAADGARHLETVLAGHHDIHQDQLRLVVLGLSALASSPFSAVTTV